MMAVRQRAATMQVERPLLGFHLQASNWHASAALCVRDASARCVRNCFNKRHQKATDVDHSFKLLRTSISTRLTPKVADRAARLVPCNRSATSTTTSCSRSRFFERKPAHFAAYANQSLARPTRDTAPRNGAVALHSGANSWQRQY